MANFVVWTCLAVSLCTVAAYSARHHDNNYLLHDTQDQQQQQQVQEVDDEDGLKTGTRSSQLEINFHPLGDFGGGAPANRESVVEAFPFEPHTRPLQPEHRQNEVHPQQQQQQQHNHHHHLKGQPQRLADDEQRNFKALKDITQATPLFSKYPHFTLPMFSNEPSIDGGINSNNENYEDIDNIYKQDMPEGNYNVHRWGGEDFGDEPTAWSWLNDDVMDNLSDGQKRNAFHAIKRQKSKKRQAKFTPGISVGAMTNLGDFFDNLKNNIDFLEKGELTDEQIQLLDGQHPLTSLKKELSSTSGENDSSWHNNGPHGTAAFIHAIRTYRPSHRIRNLISTVPEGYRGANSHDPNYKWIGLGKRSYF